MRYGVYLVVGRRQYRGHDPGTEFEAITDPAIGRAVARGDIRLLREVRPSIQKGAIRSPEDWRVPMSNQDATMRLRPSVEGG